MLSARAHVELAADAAASGRTLASDPDRRLAAAAAADEQAAAAEVQCRAMRRAAAAASDEVLHTSHPIVSWAEERGPGNYLGKFLTKQHAPLFGRDT